MSPVSTAILKGFLDLMIKDDVNFINAQIIAKERGIKVTETTSESEDYINLITVKTITTEMTNKVAGTIFGRNEARVVQINNFRLEMIPEGHLALIHNLDKPGAIGSIGNTLGKHQVNISRMHVGQEKGVEGKEDNNVIFLRTDTSIPDEVVEELRALPLIMSVTPLEL
jgi:D-3-phosphoglycerate dehydrogenase